MYSHLKHVSRQFFKRIIRNQAFSLLLLYYISSVYAVSCYSTTLPQRQLRVITIDNAYPAISFDTITISASFNRLQVLPIDSAQQVQRKTKRAASILAFPLFGIVGLHRIYLGTKVYVPIVYVVTIGGCFGILPLIDCIVLLLSKPEQIENYKNNPHIFMWMKKS